MTSNKAVAQWTIEALEHLGVEHLIFSPGSRNTPLIIAGTASKKLVHHTVLDERSAAFVALGAARQTNMPVALCCTSGSAIANYHPAVLEAFYSKIPILLLTADRPEDRIGKGEGQTCIQKDFFTPHIGASFHLNENVTAQEVVQVFSQAQEVLHLRHEPVHINISFDEPLYDTSEGVPSLVWEETVAAELDTLGSLKALHSFESIAVVCGQLSPEETQTILSENLIERSGAHWFVDPLSGLLSHEKTTSLENLKYYTPDALVSFGGQWMSKFPKFHMRSLKLALHVHVDPYQAWDVADAEEFVVIKNRLTACIDELATLKTIQPVPKQRTVPILPWSDAAAFRILLQKIELESDAILHIGNSSLPRYLEYFSFNKGVYINRGVSGIDGCVSTAVGAAMVHADRPHFLFVGDQSFLYDSGAMLQIKKVPNLKVIVFNNGVGQIFDWLPGTHKVSSAAQQVYANAQEVDLVTLARAYGVSAATVASEEVLNVLDQVQLLEIDTKNAQNSQAYSILKI